MKDQDRLKLCLSCHAQVSKEAPLCPYCRASFHEKPPLIAREADPLTKRGALSNEESLASLYPPPYQPKEISPIQEAAKVETAPLLKESIGSTNQLVAFLPWLLLGGGGYLLVFGLFLALFSKGGSLTLTWSSGLWYLYVLFALPLIWFGYQLAKEDDVSK